MNKAYGQDEVEEWGGGKVQEMLAPREVIPLEAAALAIAAGWERLPLASEKPRTRERPASTGSGNRQLPGWHGAVCGDWSLAGARAGAAASSHTDATADDRATVGGRRR